MAGVVVTGPELTLTGRSFGLKRLATPMVLIFSSRCGDHGESNIGNRLSLHPRTRIMQPVILNWPDALGVPKMVRICVRYGPMTVFCVADSNSAPSDSSLMLSISTSNSYGFWRVTRNTAPSPATKR